MLLPIPIPLERQMSWSEVLDRAQMVLLATPDITADMAKQLTFCADSHEPWCTENHREDFSEADVWRLVEWLLDNRWIIS